MKLIVSPPVVISILYCPIRTNETDIDIWLEDYESTCKATCSHNKSVFLIPTSISGYNKYEDSITKWIERRKKEGIVPIVVKNTMEKMMEYSQKIINIWDRLSATKIRQYLSKGLMPFLTEHKALNPLSNLPLLSEPKLVAENLPLIAEVQVEYEHNKFVAATATITGMGTLHELSDSKKMLLITGNVQITKANGGVVTGQGELFITGNSDIDTYMIITGIGFVQINMMDDAHFMGKITGRVIRWY